MDVQVTVDGKVEQVDVAFDSFTLQETCRIEEQLGSDGYESMMANVEKSEDEEDEKALRPLEIRAMVFAKLKTKFPQLTVTDFDVAVDEKKRAEVKAPEVEGNDNANA